MRTIYYVVILYAIISFVGLTGCDDNLESHSVENTGEKMCASSSIFDKDEWFMPIIYAYAAFELSGYTVYDKNVMGESLWYMYGDLPTYNFGSNPSFMYALYDINGDGILDLFIGVRTGTGAGISGIYVLQDGKPTSVFQVAHRHRVCLTLGDNGNYMIRHWRRHMSFGVDYFYKIDENGRLVLLDILYTNGHILNDDMDMIIGYHYAKDVGGEQVDITEEEFLYIFRKYGWKGGSKNAIVNLTWNYIVDRQ